MKKVKAAFRGIVIFLLCVIEIYPLFWMLTASFKKQAEWSEKPAYALMMAFISRTILMHGQGDICPPSLRTV